MSVNWQSAKSAILWVFMFDVVFFLCWANLFGVGNSSLQWRCPSCNAVSITRTPIHVRVHEEFKLHENSNRNNSRPEVDFDIIPTALIIVCLAVKHAVTNFRQVAPQVPLLKKPQKFDPNFLLAEDPVSIGNKRNERARELLATGQF